MNWTSARRSLAPVVTLFAIAGILGLGLAAYEACAIYDSSLLLPALDAGVASDAGTAMPDVETCSHATFPARPPANIDAGPDLDETVIVAFTSIDIGINPNDGGVGPNPEGGPYGYDLDHTCTCFGQGQSCVPQYAEPNCDDDAGRDHAAISLFDELGSVASTGTQQINAGLQAGQYGMLVAIRGYNGQLNDPQVNVAIYVSNGLNGVQDGGTPALQNNGQDRWTIDPSSLNPQLPAGTNCDNDDDPNNLHCQPAVVDDTAYVIGGYLVAQPLQPFPVVFGNRSFLGGATMSLSGAVLVGQLVPANLAGGGTSFNLQNGNIAGRWPTTAILGTLATIPDNLAGGGTFICGMDTLYAYIRTAVCSAADINSQPTKDNMGAACDAVSVGMTFTAQPAHLGDVYGVPPAPAGCQTSTGAAFSDTCLR